MSTKSRRRSCKSSGGSGRLGARAVEDVADTRRGSEDRRTVSGFGPQNPGKDSDGNWDRVRRRTDEGIAKLASEIDDEFLISWLRISGSNLVWIH